MRPVVPSPPKLAPPMGLARSPSCVVQHEHAAERRNLHKIGDACPCFIDPVARHQPVLVDALISLLIGFARRGRLTANQLEARQGLATDRVVLTANSRSRWIHRPCRRPSEQHVVPRPARTSSTLYVPTLTQRNGPSHLPPASPDPVQPSSRLRTSFSLSKSTLESC